MAVKIIELYGYSSQQVYQNSKNNTALLIHFPQNGRKVNKKFELLTLYAEIETIKAQKKLHKHVIKLNGICLQTREGSII